MSTPKDVDYKKRQAEFRKLNRNVYSVRRGNLNEQTQQPVLLPIEFKHVIHGDKTK